MIPVYSAIPHNPPQMGDCFRACVASILELPLDAVPHFVQHKDGGFDKRWWFRLVKWLRQFGMEPVLIDAKEAADPERITAYMGYGLNIATGPSRHSDCMHSCVYKDCSLVHDPAHGEGLTDFVDFVAFAAIDPAKYVRWVTERPDQ